MKLYKYYIYDKYMFFSCPNCRGTTSIIHIHEHVHHSNLCQNPYEKMTYSHCLHHYQ